MDNIRRLYNEDIRQKSVIAKSSRAQRTRFPTIGRERRYTIMNFNNPMEITTTDQVMALVPEKRLEWLEAVRQNPGFKEMGTKMGVKYHWFADRLRSVKRQVEGGVTLKDQTKTKEVEFGVSMEERMRVIAEETIKKAESKLGNKLAEYIAVAENQINSAMTPVNTVIKAFQEALEEVKEVKTMVDSLSKSVNARFDGGYFINKELDAEQLAKRLTKLADSVGITDSRYKVTISIIEID